MAGSISGERKNVVSIRAPGTLPRAMPSAHSAPSTVASTATASATSSDSASAFMNVALEKNLANQRSVTPTGGKAMYGVGFSAKTSTIAIGRSRKATIAPFTVR